MRAKSNRRRFDAEFKRRAIRMIEEGGHDLYQVSRDLDVRPDMLRRWRSRMVRDGKRAFPGQGTARDEELVQLRRDLERVREERDILKKAVAIFSGVPHRR